MMTAANIRKHLVRQPFRPFRIWLSDGQSLEVRHPDMCMVAPNIVFVGIPHPDEEGLVVQITDCAMLHITRIEPINGKAVKAKRTDPRRE
jgi:hypothetical protein